MNQPFEDAAATSAALRGELSGLQEIALTALPLIGGAALAVMIFVFAADLIRRWTLRRD